MTDVLSARDREAEMIEAPDRGADDCVEKPFAIGEFLARLRVALRHARSLAPEQAALVKLDGIEVALERRLVVRDGLPVRLTPKEYDLRTVFYNLSI